MDTNTQDLKAEFLERLAQAASSLDPPAQLPLRALITQLFKHTAPDDLIQRDAPVLARAVVSVWDMLEARRPGASSVRILSAPMDPSGSGGGLSIVEVNTDDMPFLVDSIRMELQRHDLGVDLIVHSIMGLQRDPGGKFAQFAPADQGGRDEAVMYLEIERCPDAKMIEQLRQDILRTLDDVRAAVSDWPQMRAKVREILRDLEVQPPPVEADELEESKAFLQWIDDHHFTFLGYRYYELIEENGEDVLRFMPGSSLGTAPPASTPAASQTFIALPPEHRAAFREAKLLVLTKANVRATVHRPGYMDYIGVKRFDGNGAVIGEHRILGLFTSAAYNRNPRDIPLLRRKVQAVVGRAGFRPYSHNGKAFLNILETYPRDELFQISEDELFENSMAILQLQERRRVRLIVRREAFGRFVSCIVFVPRDRFDTSVRERIQKILLQAFHGESVDFTVSVSESVLARCYLIIHTPPGSPFEYDLAQLESALAAAARTWPDELRSVLIQSRGEDSGTRLFRRYRDAFPLAYRDEFAPGAAARDIEDIERALSTSRPVLALYRPLHAPSGQLRFKMFAGGDPVTLSDLLPVLENMGVRVLRERPFEVKPEGHAGVWIYDFLLTQDADKELAVESIKEIFEECFAAVWDGFAENDAYNKLALRARLNWREISIVRAYARYLRQIGTTFSQSYMQQVLANNGQIARLLMELFFARFDATRSGQAEDRVDPLIVKLNEMLDAVESLDDDRILRSFLTIVQATTRTNFFQSDSEGRAKSYVVFKLNPALIPDLPLPRPMFEIFLYSPRVEAVHLRGGPVARGGLRWSDRREDFRTEVLGLMKAQMVKNAIIVPVGAKGGFVVKRPPEGGDRDALRDEVVHCYQTFIRGMLDVTDNIVDGEVVAPVQVVRYDGDDPYLVVAADKGTATFSDLANEIASQYRFWLGDGFASGGAHGYDHKKMGITARGAWECVKRHFRELGLDTQTKPFTAVGIGDMSGDVFGNGMLLAPCIKLIAAFDHRHIFLDPNPDPKHGYEERERLFRLPRSTWADYDAKSISEGGGVYSRKAKRVKLSVPIKQALGIGADALAPDDLIRAILKAPVDLLWNGGIGTYVKASSESHADVGDRSNDAVRIDATELRCRVLGEGGNLGITQKGRIEYAMGGGLINTDFIDNAGGVHCSDHEVNIKILLNGCVTRAELTEGERNTLLESMTGEIAEHVLRENYWQSGSISLMQQRAAALADEHLRFMKSLERDGALDRRIEYLPDDETFGERRAAGQGLTRPELAVLVAYAKNSIFQQLLSSDAPEDEYLSRELIRYFPPPLRERFGNEITRHRLRRELLATYVTNRLVNRMGATFVFRLQEEQGVGIADIVRGYIAIWEIFKLRDLTGAITNLDNVAKADAQAKMLDGVMRLIERGTLWLLHRGQSVADIGSVIKHYRAGVAEVASVLGRLLSVDQMQAVTADAVPLIEAGVPEDLAQHAARLEYLFSGLDIVDIAAETGTDVGRAAAMYFVLDAGLELNWLRDQIAALPADDRWRIRARISLDDEVYANLRTLSTKVLQSQPDGADAQHALQTWSAKTNGSVERYLRVVAEFKTSQKVDMAMLSVAVRQIQELARARP